jgi:hypothetical protein
MVSATPPAPRALAAHSDPEQLRRQAKELLRAWRAGDPAALARAAPFGLPAPPRLAQAQLVIARELGQPSWPALMAEVERRRTAALDDRAYTERVLALALGRGFDAPRPAQALALLQARPALRPPALQLLLGEAPALPPAAPLPPRNAPPLALVAFSSLAGLGFEAALLAQLQGLLAAGADPNAGLPDPASPQRPLPAHAGLAPTRCSGSSTSTPCPGCSRRCNWAPMRMNCRPAPAPDPCTMRCSAADRWRTCTC